MDSLIGPAVAIVCVLLTVGGTIAVALLRKPVDVTALWEENRALGIDKQQLNDRMDAMDAKFSARFHQLAQRQQIVIRGFIASLAVISRVKATPTVDEARDIDAARAIAGDDSDWDTEVPANH